MHDLSPTGDFAIVRVDREITAPGAVALKVRDSGAISVGRNIGVIGYPSGLPVKIAFGAATVVIKEDDPWLFANLDTYGGNSGSAVFNKEGLVEGILVHGARDYDLEATCFKSNNIMDSEGSEVVTKASAFVSKIPGRNPERTQPDGTRSAWMAKRGPNFSKFLLNCEESRGRETDWRFSDAVTAQSVGSSIANLPPPKISRDLSNTNGH